MRGQRHHRRVLPLLHRSEAPCCFEPVELRHLHVHQHEVERPRLEQRQRLMSAGRRRHRVPEAAERLGGELVIDRMVVHHEHAQRAAGLQARRKRERKRALAQLHRHADGVDQLALADRPRHRHQLVVRRIDDRDDADHRHRRLPSRGREQAPVRDHARVRLANVRLRRLVHRAVELRDEAVRAEHVAVERARGRIRLDHDDARSRERALPLRRDVAGDLVGGEEDVEAKDRPFSALALEIDHSAHRFDQARHDRQPEARAAEAPRPRPLSLLERLEDPPLLRHLDPDAGVAHLEADAEVVAVGRVAPHPHDDLPRGGELDRVAEKVH